MVLFYKFFGRSLPEVGVIGGSLPPLIFEPFGYEGDLSGSGGLSAGFGLAHGVDA